MIQLVDIKESFSNLFTGKKLITILVLLVLLIIAGILFKFTAKSYIYAIFLLILGIFGISFKRHMGRNARGRNTNYDMRT